MLKRAFSVRTACLFLFLVIAFEVSSRTEAQTKPSKPEAAEVPVKVTLCDLRKNAGDYDHKLIEVTGFVSHGFEDFRLYDPVCDDRSDIWLEYGGRISSGTIYCCGVTNRRRRPKPLVVEKIPTQLIADERYAEFDKLIQPANRQVLHVTLVGRFFAGKKQNTPNGSFWAGFGHFGSFSLLVIQQVLAIDPRDRSDLDYQAFSEHIDLKAGCSTENVLGYQTANDLLKILRTIETGQQEWSYTDPQRVATDVLARLLKIEERSITNFRTIRSAQGRMVYEWRPANDGKRYVVVVSRPYALSLASKDFKRIPWVPIGVTEIFCE
jgi:hypothetical protein